MMGDVVSLSEWKEKLEKDELDALAARVSDLIENLREDGLLEPSIYPPEYDISSMTSSTNWLIDGYNMNGMATHADIVLEPNVASCSKTLAWVSYVLSDMGRNYESTMIDEVIERLEEEDV
jgi:orotate phosphoribosyltransferase-like protein